VISTPRILRIFQITGLTKALAVQRSAADAMLADPHWQRTAEDQAGSVHEWCRQHGLS
jgi:anti-sigma B factor antagonist